MKAAILITGGAGYIGSHLCKALAKDGYTPIVYDSFKTGHRSFVRWGPYVEGDMLDVAKLSSTIREFSPLAIFHLAADSHVRSSLTNPLLYYKNNLGGVLSLLEALTIAPVPYLVFSSSAAVYGAGSCALIKEDAPLKPINPYGQTKLMAEQMIADFCATKEIRYANLRYFNAAGADLEKEIGESHSPESHVIPLLIEVLQRKRECFVLFGKHHPTRDGTACRDFIHVTDLAEGHLAALRWMQVTQENITLNLGSGKGYTILEIIEALERKVSKKIKVVESIPLEEPATLIADSSLAQDLLQWTPVHSSLDQILETALRWHS